MKEKYQGGACRRGARLATSLGRRKGEKGLVEVLHCVGDKELVRYYYVSLRVELGF